MPPDQSQDDVMLQAAHLYYEENLTQAEIGKRLYLSRTKVCRLLNEARECGRVSIHIEGQQLRNCFLECLFSAHYNLKKVIILSRCPDTPSKMLDAVAAQGAKYMDSILEPSSIVAISRGKTMARIVANLHPRKPLPIKAVQLIGLMNNPSHNEEEMDLVRRFAIAYGGTYYNLFSPFILEDDGVRKMLDHVAAVGDTIHLAKQANIVLTSLGKVTLKDHNTLWNSYLDEEEQQRIIDQGAVGLFCGHYYDQWGKLVDAAMHEKIIGLDMESLVCKEHVVGVVSGEEKVIPILGALRGKLINTLITDEWTAVNVLIQDGRPFSFGG